VVRPPSPLSGRDGSSVCQPQTAYAGAPVPPPSCGLSSRPTSAKPGTCSQHACAAGGPERPHAKTCAGIWCALPAFGTAGWRVSLSILFGSEHTRSHPLSTRRNLGLLPCVTKCRSLRIRRVTFVARRAGPRRLNTLTKLAALPEPPWGIEPQTYALRACHDALLPGSGRHRRCGSQGAAVGGCWLLVVHGPSGAPRGTTLLPVPYGLCRLFRRRVDGLGGFHAGRRCCHCCCHPSGHDQAPGCILRSSDVDQRSVSDQVASGALGMVHVAVTVAVNAGCSEEAFPRLARADAVPGQPGEALRK
jgi:hypothetical protein